MKKFWFTAILAASIASAASAQVGSINSAATSTEVRSDPSSTLVVTNNYPSAITISDQNVSQQTGTGFAPNKTDWFFSNNGGTSAYLFDNNDFFTTSMTLTLTATNGATSPRKEAGYLLNTPTDGQGQFILDTDAHEIVAFGGPFPFYAFPKVFQSGDTVMMGITYALDSSGKRAITYTADDFTQNTGLLTSPAQELTNLEQGIITGSSFGGYEQTTVDTTNPTNGITAVFSNISISAAPEPSGWVSLMAGALSLGGLLLLRRRAAR